MFSKAKSASLGFLLTAGACGGGHPAASSLESVFNTPALNLLLAPQASAGLAATVGSLETVITDSQSGARYAYPVCSGIQVSPKHLLTASHCPQTNTIFNKHRIAVPSPDPTGSGTTVAPLQFLTFGNVVRLSYDGDVDPQAGATEAGAAVLAAPLYADAQLDFAVYELPAAQAGGDFVDLCRAGRINPKAAGTAEIWGFPNGVPLTQGRCHALLRSSGPWVAHDCDALSGSSGGLIGNDPWGRPLAMHLAGPADNDGAYYTANGHFESPSDFALRRGCPKGADGNPAADCLLEKGYNRALPLQTIKAELIEKAPAVWRSMIAAIDGKS